MLNLRRQLLNRAMVVIHFFVMMAIFVICRMAFFRCSTIQTEHFAQDRAMLALYAFMYILMSKVYSCYDVGSYKMTDLLINQTLANLISMGSVYIFICIIVQQLTNIWAYLCAFVLQTLFSTGWLWAAKSLYLRFNRPQRMVAFYRSGSDLSMLAEVKRHNDKWTVDLVVQCVDREDKGNMQDRLQEASGTDDRKLRNAWAMTRTDRVIGNDIFRIIDIMKDYDAVLVSGVNATLRNGILKHCIKENKNCFFVPHTGDVITAGATHMRFLATPVCRAARSKPLPEILFLKRLFDLVISVFAIAALSPLMIAVAISIKLYDHGPVLYRQTRLTRDGQEFRMVKFRSMRVDAEKDGVARLAMENDERITPVGRFCRAFRLDELPQLFNVLRGSMSIVGPRPERPEIAAQYEKELPAFSLRLQVKAGITGYAQIYGRYNSEPADKLKMDLMYINSITRGHVITEDLRLILETIRILLMKDSTAGIARGQTTALRPRGDNSVCESCDAGKECVR